jgi:hypothetical protein
VIGSAAGPRPDGGSISCALDLRIELSGEIDRSDQWIDYGGVMGGDVQRTTLDSTGAGFGFWADVYWPTTVARLVLPDSIELLLGDTTITDSRFWRSAWMAASARGGRSRLGDLDLRAVRYLRGSYVDYVRDRAGRLAIRPG